MRPSQARPLPSGSPAWCHPDLQDRDQALVEADLGRTQAPVVTSWLPEDVAMGSHTAPHTDPTHTNCVFHQPGISGYWGWVSPAPGGCAPGRCVGLWPQGLGGSVGFALSSARGAHLARLGSSQDSVRAAPPAQPLAADCFNGQ